EKERNTTREHVDALTIILVCQEKEIAEKTNQTTSYEAKISSHTREIEQNQRTIEHIKNKMAEIAARTGVRKPVRLVFFAVTVNSNHRAVASPGGGLQSIRSQDPRAEEAEEEAGGKCEEAHAAVVDQAGDAREADPGVRGHQQSHPQAADRLHHPAEEERTPGG
ncbi:unnamed protein product, partial [Tetraodon nigroviridis]